MLRGWRLKPCDAEMDVREVMSQPMFPPTAHGIERVVLAVTIPGVRVKIRTAVDSPGRK